MAISKRTRIVLYVVVSAILVLTAYILSFDSIEPVCNKTRGREVFLLNYISKKGLKDKVYKHCEGITFKGTEYTRVYLLHEILRIPDPIFGDAYNYKPTGCDTIDMMDIYCIADFEKQEDGKIIVTYNFMEDTK